MNPDYYQHALRDRLPTRKYPNAVKVGGKIVYRGKDASEWLKKQTDRNIKSVGRLVYN